MPESHILIVDDNASVRLILSETFKLAGFRVTVAADSNEALASIDEPPNIALVDVMLPGRDGYTLCRLLRQDPATAKLPIILLSARSGADQVQKALAAGADRFLPKPFEPKCLVNEVTALLVEKRAA